MPKIWRRNWADPLLKLAYLAVCLLSKFQGSEFQCDVPELKVNSLQKQLTGPNAASKVVMCHVNEKLGWIRTDSSNYDYYKNFKRSRNHGQSWSSSTR